MKGWLQSLSKVFNLGEEIDFGTTRVRLRGQLGTGCSSCGAKIQIDIGGKAFVFVAEESSRSSRKPRRFALKRIICPDQEVSRKKKKRSEQNLFRHFPPRRKRQI